MQFFVGSRKSRIFKGSLNLILLLFASLSFVGASLSFSLLVNNVIGVLGA